MKSQRVTTITTVTLKREGSRTVLQPCSLRACCSLRDQTQYRLFRTRKWIKLRPYDVPIQSCESVIRRLRSSEQQNRAKSLVSSHTSNAKVTLLESGGGEQGDWGGIRTAAEEMRRVGEEMQRLELSLSQLVTSMEQSRASISP